MSSISNWKELRFGDFLKKASRFESKDDLKEYQFAGTYSYGRGIFKSDVKIGSSFQLAKLQRIKAEDFIYCKIMAWEGAFGVAPKRLDGCVMSGAFVAYEIDKAIADPKFINYFFQLSSTWERIGNKSTGTNVRRKSLHPSIFENESISLPSIDEQKRIVSQLDFCSSNVNRVQELSKNILSDGESLLISMSHRNDLSEQEKITQGWKLTKLADVLTQVSNPVDVEMGEHYPHFGIYGFAKGLFAKAPLDGSEIKAKKLYRAESGYFMYSRLKAFEGAFGMVPESLHDHYVSNEFPCFLVDGDYLNNEFLAAYLMSPSVWRQLAIHSKGVGARRERLKPVNFLDYEIWLPPLAWQQKIKQVSEKLAVVRTEREKNMQKLDALLPAILDKAFKGEL